MDTEKLIGLIIGGIAIVGGLAVGAIVIYIAVPWSTKEKLAKMDIRSKERMAMLEKGIDPTLIFREPKRVGQDPLLWGLLLAGMGTGILLGYLVHLITGWDRSVLINSLAILFGGLGLVVFSLSVKKTEARNAV